MAFHHYLDRLFQKRLTFSIFFRIWLAFTLVVSLASGLAVYQLQKNIRPSAQRVVEDTLVDTSRLVAVMVGQLFGNQIQTGTLDAIQVDSQLNTAFFADSTWLMPIWFHQKNKSQFRVYITDSQGIVLYDSRHEAVGADYSRWNDVYLTLRGKYGARSTRTDMRDEQSSIMYVASPIVDANNRLIGVVSIGKPVATLMPYINASRDEILKTMAIIAGFGVLFSAFMAWWLRHSIQAVNAYTKRLANTTPPHFYLAKELNELIDTIDTMKNTIENKAYVTEYVHTLTHELKSPLTAIRASGELLGDDLPSHDREQFSQTILEQSDKLQHLVEQLLVIAKLEQPNFKLALSKQSLYALLTQAFDNQQAWLVGRGLQVVITVDKELTLKVDKFWLQQALQNLVDNAIKFANQFILVTAEVSDDSLTLLIINDSEPVADFVLERAFERYFSVENHLVDNAKTGKTSKGTGLGLTLVKTVVELHGGQIVMMQKSLGDFIINKVMPSGSHTLSFVSRGENCIGLYLQLPKALLC